MNLGYVKSRIRSQLYGTLGPSTALTVRWQVAPSGVVPDVVTGALVGAPLVEVSGTLPVFWHQVNAATKLRQYAEIQVGDVLVDLDPAAPVTVYPGQPVSGVVALDALAEAGLVFERAGQRYVQAEVGEALAEAWSVVVGGQELLRTMLLRKAT